MTTFRTWLQRRRVRRTARHQARAVAAANVTPISDELRIGVLDGNRVLLVLGRVAR